MDISILYIYTHIYVYIYTHTYIQYKTRQYNHTIQSYIHRYIHPSINPSIHPYIYVVTRPLWVKMMLLSKNIMFEVPPNEHGAIYLCDLFNTLELSQHHPKSLIKHTIPNHSFLGALNAHHKVTSSMRKIMISHWLWVSNFWAKLLVNQETNIAQHLAVQVSHTPTSSESATDITWLSRSC